MSDIWVNGVWRMDWGLGNPNKTAALIAVLMVAVWGLAYVRKWGFYAAWVAFVALGVCLVHTLSRGGLVALGVGMLPLLYFAPRPWPMRRVLAGLLALVCVGAFAIYLNAPKRYTQGMLSDDRSITNRVAIWKVAPQMMVDVPWGWGIGNSGKAYMLWYSPLDSSEGYRTLVNSHLTWLVEFNWPLRFLYLFAWAGIFVLCWPTKGARWLSIPLGIWLAFATGAAFSSVAESVWLWVVPVLALIGAVGYRFRKHDWPRVQMWRGACYFAILGCAVCFIAGWNSNAITGSRNQVVIGKGKSEIWIVADEKVLGENYGRTLRKFIQENGGGVTIGVVTSPRFLKNAVGTLVVAGGHAEHDALGEKMRTASKVILLCPSYFPQEVQMRKEDGRKVEVIYGEFSQSPSISAWAELCKPQFIPGAGDYLPEWPQEIFD